MPGLPDNAVFLSLGGNMGDPAAAMAAALRMLDGDPDITVILVSAPYRTPPWGKLDQPDFINVAAILSTNLPPRALLDRCLEAERRLKRVRAERWGPRLVDIDIILFGEQTVNEPGLEIPHPRMLERAFVLVPMAEIAPDHRFRGATLAEHAFTADRSGIEKMDARPDWWRFA